MKNSCLPTIKRAFPLTIPVLSGYLFLGAAFGLLMSNLGFSPWIVFIMSTFIYAGSAQFVTASLLIAPFQPIATFFIIFILNARHIFYGLAMYKRYSINHRIHPYLIFGLTDETFSILSSIEVENDVDAKSFYLIITLLHQLYWISGSLLGAFLGLFQNTQIKGLEFVLTALFLVLFVENIKKAKTRNASIIGLIVSVSVLLLVGPTHFVLGTMVVLFIIYGLMASKLSRGIAHE